MRKLLVFLLLLIAGCDKSEFYTQDTHTWFGFPPPPPVEKTAQGSAAGNNDKPPP